MGASRDEVRPAAVEDEHAARDPSRARRISAQHATARRHRSQAQPVSVPELPRRSSCVKGEVPAVGTIIKQPELAQTLTALAEQGPDGFYKGAVAKRMVEGVRKLGGIWSLEDFDELPRGRAQTVVRRIPRRPHRVRAAAVVGRRGGHRRAQHSVRLRSQRASTVPRASISSSRRCAARIAIAPSILAIRISSRCRPSGSRIRITRPGSALRSAWIARRRATCCRASKAPSQGRRPRTSRSSTPKAIASPARSRSTSSSAPA